MRRGKSDNDDNNDNNDNHNNLYPVTRQPATELSRTASWLLLGNITRLPRETDKTGDNSGKENPATRC